MTANTTARYTQVNVGGLDVSQGLVSFEASDQPISESGLTLCQGKLVLKPWVGCLVNFDPDLNPVWNVGSPVVVDIQSDSGAYVRHPRGYLRVSQANWDIDTMTLELNLVDTLGLLSYRTPPEDASNICLGSNASVQSIANTLLARAGAPALIDGVNGALNYPIPKLTGSFIAQFGQLLFSFGYFGWVDGMNRVRATPIMSEAGRLAGVGYLGRTEVSFSPLGSGEQPTEVVKVSGVGKRSLGSGVPDPQISREYAEGMLIRETKTEVINGAGLTFSMPTLPLKYSVQGLALCKLVRTTVRGQLKTVMPQGSIWANSSVLAPLEVSEEYTYKHPKTEAILYTIRVTSRPIAVVLSGSSFWRNQTTLTFSDLTEVLAEINPITREYAKITTIEQAKGGGLFPDTKKQKDNNGWVTAKRTVETWTRQGRFNTYNLSTEAAKLITTGTSLGKGKPINIREDIILAPVVSPSKSGNSGEAQPPAVSYCEFGFNACGQPRVEMEDVPMQGVAYFASTFGQTYQERETHLSVNYASNEGQLTALAGQWGRLLWARAKGRRFAVALGDHWLVNWQPLLRFDWVDPSGVRKVYRCEAQSWVSLRDQALVSADGLYIGHLGSASYPSLSEVPPAIDPPTSGYPEQLEPTEPGNPTPTPPADPPDPPVPTPLPPVPTPIPIVRQVSEANLGLSLGMAVELLEYSSQPQIYQADLSIAMGGSVSQMDASMYSTADLSISMGLGVSKATTASLEVAFGGEVAKHINTYSYFGSGGLGEIDRFLKVYGEGGAGFGSSISPNLAVIGGSGGHVPILEGLGAGLILPDGNRLTLPDGAILIIEPLT